MADVFLKVLFFQILVAAGVIFVLKKILDHQLVELAIKKFQNTTLKQEDQKLTGILVLSSSRIKPFLYQRLVNEAQKKFNRPVEIVTKRDKSLRGGLMIKLNSATIDFTLVGRLREGGIIGKQAKE